MPSKSSKQHNLMQMSLSPEGRKALRGYGKTPVPKKVAKEFVKADKAKHKGK